MQNDEIVWEVIGPQGFCSFKAKTKTQDFCRNQYNVSGLCNRQSCPLANSRYSTLVEAKGKIYLCLKTIERSHLPSKWWERIKLPADYEKAIEIIDSELQYFPPYYMHKTKQRLTKMTEYLQRARKLLKSKQPKLQTINKKITRREKVREKRALDMAKLDNSITKELLERLKAGTYGDIYNFPFQQYENVLEKEGEMEVEADVADFAEDYEYGSDIEDVVPVHASSEPARKKRKGVEIELEREVESSGGMQQ